MRSKLVKAILVVVLGACGGVSQGGETHSDDDSSGASGLGGAAGASTGGSATTGGGAGSGGTADCSNVPYDPTRLCVPECTTDPYASVLLLICAADHYVCPEGSVEVTSCPAESCARRVDWECCNRETGKVFPSRCSADGGAQLPCEPGTVQQARGADCIPSVLDVTKCSDLDGTPCMDTPIECHYGIGCSSTTCWCNQAFDQKWTCQSLLCAD
jgi:hypothetical protein